MRCTNKNAERRNARRFVLAGGKVSDTPRNRQRKQGVALTSVPEPPGAASFLATLSHEARGFLERQGVVPGAIGKPGQKCPPSAPEQRAVRRAIAAGAGREAPRRRSKASGNDKHALRARRREQADGRHLARLDKRFEAAGVDVTQGFRFIAKHIWAMCCAVVNDESGRAARIYLRRQRNKVAVGCIRLAALVPADDGRTLYTWADERARCIAALGLALLALEVPTRKTGMWEGIVRGITVGALQALLASAWKWERVKDELRRKRPSRAALVGTHELGADLASGQVGYLKALKLAGFCYSQQHRVGGAVQLEPFERCWPSGYASNRYWVVTSIPTRPIDDDKKRELLALHASALKLGAELLERVKRFKRARPTAPPTDPSPGNARAAPD